MLLQSELVNLLRQLVDLSAIPDNPRMGHNTNQYRKSIREAQLYTLLDQIRSVLADGDQHVAVVVREERVEQLVPVEQLHETGRQPLFVGQLADDAFALLHFGQLRVLQLLQFDSGNERNDEYRGYTVEPNL